MKLLVHDSVGQRSPTCERLGTAVERCTRFRVWGLVGYFFAVQAAGPLNLHCMSWSVFADMPLALLAARGVCGYFSVGLVLNDGAFQVLVLVVSSRLGGRCGNFVGGCRHMGRGLRALGLGFKVQGLLSRQPEASAARGGGGARVVSDFAVVPGMVNGSATK